MERRELRRRKRKRQQQLMVTVIVLLLMVVIGLFTMVLRQNLSKKTGGNQDDGLVVSGETAREETGAETETETETETQTQPPFMAGLQNAMDTIYSTYGEVIRVSDGAVIAQKAADERAYPASLTKIMTTITAIEHLSDLRQSVTLSTQMYDTLYAQDASISGFSPGESVPAIDLLYGVMLPSGADSCIGLAQFISGSEAGFVELMNEKAAQLGMTGTHFTNSTGLHDDNHYTTARDLGVLVQYALENQTFREIFTASSHSTQSTQIHPDGITFQASVFKNMNEDQALRASNVILGGKTGYTQQAGLCLASIGNVMGEEFLVITMGAEGSHETVQFNIEDALTIYTAIGAV